MNFLGLSIFQDIATFFKNAAELVTLEYLLYAFFALEVLTIIVFSFLTYNVYELKLIRAVDKINAYLYNVQYVDESNLIEFNNKMKRVPKTLRYHWQQYMLYREKSPSYYMSVENCIDRPLKSSAFSSNLKIIKILGYFYAVLALIFGFGWGANTGILGVEYFLNAFMIPAVILLLNYIFVIVLQIKKSTNLGELYQTFHIFNRFIDKAVTTLPEYVDFEVLFTRQEIKRGIPVLNEYIEKRQLQEQEEMKKARENAILHEVYNFEGAGEKGVLVLERAMKETEIFLNLRQRLGLEIEQLEGEIESLKRTYENTTKDYQKKLQASKENVERLREQQEATTNRIESNYIRKQQSDEIKKQQQIEKDQDDATLRYNQEINLLASEIEKRKVETEGARKNVEKAMLAEYQTFSNKIFKDVKSEVNVRIKEEMEELIESREVVARELEDSLTKIEQLEKQNQKLAKGLPVEKAPVVEAQKEIKLEEKPVAEVKQMVEINRSKKDKGNVSISVGDFDFDTPNKKESPVEVVKEIQESPENIEYDEFGGYYDNAGNYKYKNGTFYDAEGNFHDEKNNVYDAEGNLISGVAPIESPISFADSDDSFADFDSEDPKKDSKKIASKIDEIMNEIEPEEVKVEEEPEEVKEEVDEGIDEPETETEVVVKVIKPTGKRGRPRKQIVEVVTTGKRGRPRKEVSEVQSQPAVKRGRPRKQVDQIENKPTGKRGRPKKEIVEIVVKPAGKRGRPRKEIVEKKPAGKRGRPRKDQVDEDLKKINMKLKKEKEAKIKKEKALNDMVKKATTKKSKK